MLVVDLLRINERQRSGTGLLRVWQKLVVLFLLPSRLLSSCFVDALFSFSVRPRNSVYQVRSTVLCKDSRRTGKRNHDRLSTGTAEHRLMPSTTACIGRVF